MNIWQQMESCKDTFTPKELEIYELVKRDAYTFSSSTAMAIAARYNVPQSAISRFCKKIGFSGFAEFRLSMMMASALSYAGSAGENKMDIPSNPNPKELSDYMCGLIQQTDAALSPALINQLTNRFLQSRTIYVSGYGNSHPAAYLLNLQLILNNQHSQLIQPGFEMEMLRVMGPEDTVVLFSVSNATHRDFLSLVEDLEPNKRPYVILVCCTGSHPLRRKVRQVVVLPNWLNLQYPYMVDNSIPQISFCIFLTTAISVRKESKEEEHSAPEAQAAASV